VSPLRNVRFARCRYVRLQPNYYYYKGYCIGDRSVSRFASDPCVLIVTEQLGRGYPPAAAKAARRP